MADKKERAPRARNIDELILLATKDMSDKEKANIIEYLKEQIILKDNQIEAYKENIESTRLQYQQAVKNMEDCEKFYRDKLKYVDLQSNAFITAIRESIIGGTHNGY